MGARPEFCLNSLRFGPIDQSNINNQASNIAVNLPQDLSESVDSLGRERILGVVFNGADTSRRYGDDYYGYYGKSGYGKSR